MFAGIAQLGAVAPPDETTRKILPPTPVKFPQCLPNTEDKFVPSRAAGSLVTLLQGVHRPADIKPTHFQALKIHVIPNAFPKDLIPDASFLPPIEDWNAIPEDNLLEANEKTRKPLNNGNLSPGFQTYRERQKELLIDNTAAFRTIRRIPAPAGETTARLGNAYEFYKNLEFFSGYWPDTSIPPPKPEPSIEETTSGEEKKDATPPHLQTHVRTGTGSQLPPEYRQNLLTAFVKLVAYDFGCNVSFPRTEPRLHLTPKDTESPSYFNSSITFIYRTPTERSMARAGIVEGPVAALSARASTVFSSEPEEWLDLAREVVAILLTAQQRSREKKTEKRFGEGKWWTTTPRWGGGPGGPIGREGDKINELGSGSGPEKVPTSELGEMPQPRLPSEVKRQIAGINGPGPGSNKRSRKGKERGLMQIYDNYRKMNPPGPTWDRKARYMSIGKVEGVGYDDVFLVSALNHHICVVRARIPENLLAILDGAEEVEWERVTMWRSKWLDMYLSKERVEAMELVWGMMAWLMRKIEGSKGPVEDEDDGDDCKAEKMDLS